MLDLKWKKIICNDSTRTSLTINSLNENMIKSVYSNLSDIHSENLKVPDFTHLDINCSCNRLLNNLSIQCKNCGHYILHKPCQYCNHSNKNNTVTNDINVNDCVNNCRNISDDTENNNNLHMLQVDENSNCSICHFSERGIQGKKKCSNCKCYIGNRSASCCFCGFKYNTSSINRARTFSKPVPVGIPGGASHMNESLHKLRAMIRCIGHPQVFLTKTCNEGKCIS